MDFDDVLDEIGEFGRYQITIYLLICLPVLFAAGNSLTYVFTAGVPDYRCFIPECDNVFDPDYSAPWVQEAIPPSDADTHGDTSYKPDLCTRYLPRGNWSTKVCPLGNFTDQIVRCDRWVYAEHENTIVNEWNITCTENQWKLSLVGTMHFAGILVGSLLFGFMADRIGRKLVFVFCILLMSITGIAQAISSNYLTFQVFVFINALGTAGVYPLAFIIGVELVGKKKREMSGIVLNYFYAVGEALVGLVAWIFKDWVTLQLIVSAPPMIFVLYYWFVPESVRWLLAKRHNERAKRIIKNAALINGVTLSTTLLEKVDNINVDSDTANGNPTGLEKPTLGVLDSILQICKNRRLLLRSLNLFYNWAANAFVYYGLSINSTSLGGNKYLNFALVCLVEIPGYTMAWVCMNRMGRRRSLCTSLFLCSATCVAAAFVPEGMNWAEVLLFLVGKLGITSSFGVVYVYTAELYPTVMRSAGVGASSTMARLGAMVAPFAPLLGMHMKSLPLLLFGAVALLAGLLALFFPETLGKKLPDTVDEIKKL